MRRFVGGRGVLRQAGAVTGLGNEGDECRRVGLAVVVGDLCFFAGEIDAGGGDEGLFVEDFFDAAGAGLAGHAVDVVADFLLHGFLTGRVSSIGADKARGYIAILLKPHTALRRLAVQPRAVFGGAPCMRLYEYCYMGDGWAFSRARAHSR